MASRLLRTTDATPRERRDVPEPTAKAPPRPGPRPDAVPDALLEEIADPVRRLQVELLRELLALFREGNTKAAVRAMLRSKDPKTQERGFTMLFDVIAKLSTAAALKSPTGSDGGGSGEAGVRIFFGDVPRPAGRAAGGTAGVVDTHAANIALGRKTPDE